MTSSESLHIRSVEIHFAESDVWFTTSFLFTDLYRNNKIWKIYRVYRAFLSCLLAISKKQFTVPQDWRADGESLSFAFIKLREMSIGRALLTRRILWRPFHKTRPSICGLIYAILDVCISVVHVRFAYYLGRVATSRNAKACGRRLCYSCAFAKRRRLSGVCQAHDTRHREFSLYKQAPRVSDCTTFTRHLWTLSPVLPELSRA